MFTLIDNYDVQETRRIAREKGIKLGEAKGEAKGIKKGKKEEREKFQREIVLDMKNEGFADDLIARIAKLPIEKVREIFHAAST